MACVSDNRAIKHLEDKKDGTASWGLVVEVEEKWTGKEMDGLGKGMGGEKGNWLASKIYAPGSDGAGL